MRIVCGFVALTAAAAMSVNFALAAEPVSVRDAFDRTVTVPRPPQRIVTIFSSNAELVAALGLADRIVGIEAFTRYPPEILNRPLVGGRLGFSVDAVVEQRPDLVVVTPAREAANQLVEPMERLGIPIVVLMQRTVAEIIANIRLLGRLTGVPERGEAVAAALEGRLARVAREVEPLDRPRVVMIRGRVANGLLLIARPETYTGDAVVLAGGSFAIGKRGLLSQVSPEVILNSDPDVLLYAGSKADLDDLISYPGWRDMRAVKSRRTNIVNRVEFLIPGPRTFDGIEKLAVLLHPAKP
jgi:iron complex transport system substrate-binding protein